MYIFEWVCNGSFHVWSEENWLDFQQFSLRPFEGQRIEFRCLDLMASILVARQLILLVPCSAPSTVLFLRVLIIYLFIY